MRGRGWGLGAGDWKWLDHLYRDRRRRYGTEIYFAVEGARDFAPLSQGATAFSHDAGVEKTLDLSELNGVQLLSETRRSYSATSVSVTVGCDLIYWWSGLALFRW